MSDYISKMTQYFGGIKNRTNDQGTREGKKVISNFVGSKRILVRPVAAVHAARFAISSINVSPLIPERMECDYFVTGEKAQQLVEAGEVFLLKDLHGKIIEEQNNE
jgi:hypothetical protein